MKKLLVRATAFVSLVVASSAHAVPVWFEFTGIAGNGGSGQSPYYGQSFVARLTVETDGLVFEERNAGQPWFDMHLNFAAAPQPSPFTLELSIGGVAIPFDLPYTNSAILFKDECAVVCEPFQGPDTWELSLVNRSLSNAEANAPNNTLESRHFSFTSYGSNILSRADVFDAGSIARLPIDQSYGSLVQYTSICVNGTCEYPEFVATRFDFTSVSRGVGARSVPEPATLGLLTFGLLGAMVVRRKKNGSDR